MAFELYQLHVLMKAKEGNTEVAPIPSAVSRHLGCHQTMAYLSSDSIRHIFRKHPDLDMFELLHMPDMVRHGLWLTDYEKPHMAIVVYQPPDTSPRYASALKVTGSGFEPYMSSFYRLRDRDYRAKLKRGDVLRPHL
jgi:hypothetical protein